MVRLLPIIINEYNNTVHSIIGMKPVNVKKKDEGLVLKFIINNRPIHPYKLIKFQNVSIVY